MPSFHAQPNQALNLFTTVQNALKCLQIEADMRRLRNLLLNHPNYPSLASLRTVLNDLHIVNLPVRIDTKQLDSVPLPAIVLFHGDTAGYGVLTSVTDQKVEIVSSITGRIEKMSRSIFEQQWSNFLVVLESLQPRNATKRLSSKWLIIAWLGLWVISLVAWIQPMDPVLLPLFVLKIMGLSVASLLLLAHYDSDFGHSVCKGLHRMNQCMEVTESSFAVLFKKLHLSRLGWIYFVATLSLLLFQPISMLPLTAWASLLSLPVLFYGLYVQFFRLRQRCFFCLCIAGVLFLEISVCTYSGVFFKTIAWAVEDMAWMVWILLSCLFLEYAIKRIVEIRKQKRAQQDMLRWYKSKWPVFEALHKTLPALDTLQPDHEWLIWKPMSTDHSVVLIIHLQCAHCRDALDDLQSMRSLYDTLRIALRIALTKEDTEAVQVVQVLAAHREASADDKLKMLLEYYDQPDWTAWSGKHAIKDPKKGDAHVIAQKTWFESTAVQHYPMLIYNGKVVSPQYNLRDLNVLLSQKI